MAATYMRYVLMPGKWLKVIEDEDANNSAKTYTVPDGVAWEPRHLLVEYAASADVGSRLLAVEFLDDANDVIGTCPVATPTVTAGQTMRFNLFASCVSKNPATGAAYGTDPLSPILLPPGYKIKVYDSAAIAATADDVTVHLTVVEHTSSGKATG